MADTNTALLATELYDTSSNEVGTGMLLVHPPYGIQDDLKELLPSLGKALGKDETTKIKVEQLL